MKAFKSKATREIEVFTSKVNKEIVAFENKIKKDLESIKAHSAKKTEEKQKVNEALNNLIYTQGQESKKADVAQDKQENKPAQETQKLQEVKVNPTQNQTKGQENPQAHPTNKPN
ncbi:hypothetical protein NHP190002_12400 [Helicobacter ailurogastricus]|uniref:hypothetical protein n=1 Tax=Helicobacter ailurogastricus TaxID=1578720 RepID=UPI00244D8C7B|nr:hypothetical protein [Helicobacter ailurogastricus]GMB90538.1 hypothetical protein NHP190002_12400 [Helicobacter ailurogastricus]